jgi:Transcriptional regulator, AbiEi antitoxin
MGAPGHAGHMKAVPVSDPSEYDELRARQHGVLSRQQALAVGLSSSTIATWLGAGHWQRLHHGVYATFSGEPGRPALLWAAVLRTGRPAVLSYATAAELNGFAGPPAPAIHVTVPSGSRASSRDGIVVHYSGRVIEARHPVLLPPRTRVEETVLDLANAARNLDQAFGWIFRACGSGRTTVPKLRAAMQLRPQIRWRVELSEALNLADAGVHSLLEFRYINRAELPHGLPAGHRQFVVIRAGRRQYQDVRYDPYRVVVELDGQAAHPVADRWSDIGRDNANLAAGFVTLRYGWVDVTERPCRTAAEVGAVLYRGGWSGQLHPCGPTCELPAVTQRLSSGAAAYSGQRRLGTAGRGTG